MMFITKFFNNLSKVVVCGVLWISVCTAAHAAVFHFGPCEGKISEKGYGKTGSGTISAAVVIPKEQLARYAGAQVKAVRIALVKTDGFSNLSVWMRHSLQDTDVASVDVTSPQTGWNDVELAGGMVSGTEDIVIGYSFNQEVTAQCMSVAGPASANGYWVAKNGEWTDKSGDNIGSLGIELVIEGDNVPEMDLGITGTKYDAVTEFGSEYHVTVGLQNISNQTLDGYSYMYKVNGGAASSYVVNKQLAPFGRDTLNLTLPSDIVEKGIKIPVTIEVVAENDGYIPNNTATVYMSTYDSDNKQYHHNVLLEEFSTELCGNCPRAINTIEQCMEMGYDKNVIQVTHHSGYNYDFLSTYDDQTMEWFYGGKGIYAPAAMLDRLDDNSLKEMLGGKDGTPVMSVGYANTYQLGLEYATSRPAFVSVTPVCSYDAASRRLDITVDVEKDEVFDAQCTAPRLMVQILQDSILHHNQAGYSSSSAFKHRHVYRTSVTPLFGEELEWEGNKAQMKYTYVLPDAIESQLSHSDKYDNNVDLVAQDVEVVAFVGSYNADDCCACTVYNAGRYELKADALASVGGVEEYDAVPVAVEYFTPSGIRIARIPSAGIYIERMRYADGKMKTRVCVTR